MDTTTDDMRTQQLRREIAQRREVVGRDLEVIGDRVSPGRMADRSRERARRRVYSLRERVMGPVMGPRDSAGRTTFAGSDGDHRGVGDRVGDLASGMTDHDPAGAVAERVEGSPLVMGLVAFGIGFVAGSVIPPSRSEQAVAKRLEPAVAEVAQGAAESVREAQEHLAPVVQEEASSLQEEVRSAATNAMETGKEHAAAARREAAS